MLHLVINDSLGPKKYNMFYIYFQFLLFFFFFPGRPYSPMLFLYLFAIIILSNHFLSLSLFSVIRKIFEAVL